MPNNNRIDDISLSQLNIIDNLYTLNFSTKEKFGRNEIYKDKYMKLNYVTNYVMINDVTNIKQIYELYKDNNSFIEFKIIGDKSNSFDFISDKEIYRINYFVADKSIINNIEIKEDINLVLIDENHKDEFVSIIFSNSLCFGESYAKANLKRMYDVLFNKESDIKYYFMYKNNTVIGYGSGFIKDRILKIEDINISDKYKNMGYGKTIIKEIAKYYDWDILYTVSLDESADFYKKIGFCLKGHGYLIRKIF